MKLDSVYSHAIVIIGLVLLASCASNDGGSTSRSSGVISRTTTHVSGNEFSRYAMQIGGVVKAIHTCAWDMKNDADFITGNEAIAMCDYDNKSIDGYLVIAAPDGFANTQSQLHRLRNDLEIHNPNSVVPDPDFRRETADAALIVKSFTKDLNATNLPQTAKQHILKYLQPGT